MVKILLFFAFVIIFVVFPAVRCIVCNPHLTLWFGSLDLFHYFRYKIWRNATCGELICYTGLFGKGKTLSAVHNVVSRYKRYNDKLVYDKYRRKFVKQRILILSNVELVGIPYKKFESLEQLVKLSHQVKDLDDEYNTLTYIYVLGDEFSVQLNSRSFKTNISPTFLNTLLTCRHYHISLFYTAQRFNQVDALLRQVTQTVVDCNKVWRLQLQKFYDGYELENCTNPTLVKPLVSRCWFVRDKDYGYYDTLACVTNLEKAQFAGDMISDKEILELQGTGTEDSVVHYSKRAKKRRPFRSK